MATIEEDYVSNETAKLLKEKGFDWYTYAYYEDEDNLNISFRASKAINWNKTEFISKPTLQMAMKWLREVHNIHFIFDPYLDENYNIRYSIIVVFGSNVVDPIYKTDGDFTYEQACEAAIKYCLKHLI